MRSVWLYSSLEDSFLSLRVHAREAAERARVVEDFHQRRREAAANKLRGQAQWLAPSPTPLAPQSQGMVASVLSVCWEGERGRV